MSRSNSPKIIWNMLLLMLAIVLIVVAVKYIPFKGIGGEVKEAGTFVQGGEQDYCGLHEGYWNNVTDKCQISETNTTEIVIVDKKPVNSFADSIRNLFSLKK